MSIFFDEWHKINTQFTPYRPKRPNISPNPPTPTPYTHHSLFSLNSNFSKFSKFPNPLPSLLLLLIFAERVSDIAHSEARVIRIVAGLQPELLSESCVIGEALYAKRKGANLAICSNNILLSFFSQGGGTGVDCKYNWRLWPTLKAEYLGSAKLRS